MKKYGVIYILINKINGKCYVGQTTQLEIRMNAYRRLDCEEQPAIFNALKKYGWNNFSNEIIEKIYGGQYSLDLIEIKWIKYLCTVEFGYNLDYGGRGTGKHSEETKQKMSAARAKEKHPMWGKNHSQVSKEKMSQSRKGMPCPDSVKKTLAQKNTGSSHPFFGQKHSHETKNIMSKKAIERVSDVSKRQRLLDLNFGKNKKIYCNNTDESFDSINHAARELKLSCGNISAQLRGLRKRVKGYTFKYIDKKDENE